MTATTAPSSPTWRIGAWRVDCAVDEISKDGNSVKLERRAMQPLVCLAEHAGQVVSVEQLFDQVWTGDMARFGCDYRSGAARRGMVAPMGPQREERVCEIRKQDGR